MVSLDDVATRAGAVSYTHLDVYKRQAHCNSICKLPSHWSKTTYSLHIFNFSYCMKIFEFPIIVQNIRVIVP